MSLFASFTSFTSLLPGFGDVEEAEEAAFGGEGVNGGEEFLEAAEILRGFDELEGFGAGLTGVVPALRDAGCACGGIEDLEDLETGLGE